ncbi:2OG-Fe(II) oxygenase [Methylobacterium sp. CB376]|uniref:2OG-Fe(II) oxygenase n=1 Tax=unclassified Methylobacterium TaxID=2615210 RepID=UPI000152D9F9|nr:MULTISPECIES: 2OG-Fe(II) oxygenase [Methylobacterium]WFT83099.1 2OG-Fe(II) oxygenase [Methylobacterium nodulans]
MQRDVWNDDRYFSESDLATLRDVYRNAAPFPHLVLKDVFSESLLDLIVQEYGTGGPALWTSYNTELMRKRITAPNSTLPAAAQLYFDVVSSPRFIRFLSSLTGIQNLLPDPSLFGGGMHEVSGSGLFEVHVDFQSQPETKLDNRLALITYLDRDGTDQDGGALELWYAEPARRGAVIAPVFGTTLIMGQSATAAHGHPRPVRPGRARRALIAYYYTNGRQDGGRSDSRATVYVRHPSLRALQRLQIILRGTLPRPILAALKALYARFRT